MAAKRVIRSAQAPAAVGPYSQAVRVGDWVVLSGQIPLDPTTGTLVGTTPGEQAAQCLRNLTAVLAAAGLGTDDVIKTTIYLTDMAAFGEVNEVYGRVFGTQDPPARATVGVSALPKGALVEIEAWAVAGD